MLDFAVQFLATALLLAGLWLMGSRRLLGPFLAFMAELLWFVVGVTHHVWSAWVIGGILFVVQLRNFVKWKREGAPW